MTVASKQQAHTALRMLIATHIGWYPYDSPPHAEPPMYVHHTTHMYSTTVPARHTLHGCTPTHTVDYGNEIGSQRFEV